MNVIRLILREGADLRDFTITYDDTFAKEWLDENQDVVVRSLGTIVRAVQVMKLMPDPKPWERPAPADCMTPSRLAAAIRSRLEVVYPDETFELRVVTP